MNNRQAEPLFTNIVVGTDGTEHGAKAVTAATELAATNPDAKVHVVMAFHPLSSRELADLSAELPEEFRSVLHSHYPAESTLGEARRLTQAHGVDATFHEIDDDPTDAILRLAADVGPTSSWSAPGAWARPGGCCTAACRRSCYTTHRARCSSSCSRAVALEARDVSDKDRNSGTAAPQPALAPPRGLEPPT